MNVKGLTPKDLEQYGIHDIVKSFITLAMTYYLKKKLSQD